MFYLLISKLWIRELTNKYDLFKLFTYGSVGYVLLHFYLNMRTYTGMLGMLKSLFYYIMIIDFVLAYCLISQSSTKIENYTNLNDPEKQAIINKIEELNKITNEKEGGGNNGVFLTKKESEKKASENKAKITIVPPQKITQEASQNKSDSDELPEYKEE